MSNVRLIRLPIVQERYGNLSRSTLYRLVGSGLWPAPVNLGERAVAWPSDECELVAGARIAGKSDDEIRKLVAELAARRTQLMIQHVALEKN